MIEYDRFGRMKYNPEFHKRSGMIWNKDELDYLINWYDKIGAEEMSFALERPITSVAQKVNILRGRGVMQKPTKYMRHVRARYEDERNMR